VRRFRHRSLAFPTALLLAFTFLAAPALAANNLRDAKSEVTTTPAPRHDVGWVQRQEMLNKRVKKHQNAQLLFIGDSITHGWEGNGAKEIWQQYYKKRHAINLGIGGDRTEHVLWRLDNGNLDGLHPKLAVLMIGTNNASAGNTPEEIADGVRAIVEKLRAKTPECKVLILAIFPRGETPKDHLRQVNEGANERIAKLADDQHVFYLDIGPKFLGPDGTLSKEIMPDRLHPNEKGYQIWADSIEPTVARLLGESS
jgi:lysophospholipase L1-like esterase